MSPSSGGEWGARDVIDLDQYMRGHGRPPTSSSEDIQQCEQLVVDGGGIGRKLVSEARYKHHSHDSGVSDGSYGTRRHHRPRRVSNSDGRFGSREQTSARTFTRPAHSDSLQAFRTVCQQALLDQQKQIARVTQLCEQLTERADERTLKKDERINERLSGRDKRVTEQNLEKRNDRERVKAQSDTSDISSSSRSTSDQRRKEKHRTQECKTYKIIMSKLDELNRRFSSAPSPPIHHPCPPSSGSVSVCDKRVATDLPRTVDKVIRPTSQRSQLVGRCAAPVSMKSRARMVTHAYSVDIAPRHFMQRAANVATESVVKCESDGSGSSAEDPRCHFDLEDPVHLYSQAKRLQALNATIRRGRSHSSADSRSNVRACSNAPVHASARASKVRERSPSICSMCRGYWRSLRHCIVAPFVQECS